MTRLRMDDRFVYRPPDGGAVPIIDEYSRECLSIVVARSIPAERVVGELDRLFASRGRPVNLRSDNGHTHHMVGGEFIAGALRHHLRHHQVETRYIEPGAPWQNGFIERHPTTGGVVNNTFRDELLNRELFSTVLEAEVLAEQYRRHYNEHRPHSGLQYQTPNEFAVSCSRSIPAVNLQSGPTLT